jgi:hypothetical protein
MDNPSDARVGAGLLAAIYTRAPEPSEPEQATVAEQLASCRSLAAELGYDVSEEATITDTGSGTVLGRPGLSALLALIAGGRVAAVFTHTASRLGRPESRPLEALLKVLRARGIPLYVARIPRGYRYDPATGDLAGDAEEIAAANREEWRPPERVPIPREALGDWDW